MQTAALDELGCGGLCPHPLRKLSFLRTFLLLPPLRTNAASSPDAGASRDHRGAAQSVRSSPALETYPAVKRRPPARRPRRLSAAATACRLSLPFRLFELHFAIQIRSEVSAPARLCPRNVDAIGGAFVPTDFWFGRAGDTDGGYFLRRRSWAAAGSARTRLGN